MELKNFIRETLEQICLGIKEAQDSTLKTLNNHPIAPAIFNGKQINETGTPINFDIAISVTSDEKLNVDGRVGVSIAEAAVTGQNSSSTEKINRISFSVPFYPTALHSRDKGN